jgi:hypothetical protein
MIHEVNVKFKWAVLNVLAKWPDRRVTFAEIRREVGNIPETGNQIEQARFSELGDIDLLKAGLVLLDDVGLQITDAGLSLLRSLESSAALPPTAPSSSASQLFELLDSQIGTEERLKIFDIELRRLVGLPASEEEEEPMKVATLDATVDDRVVELPGTIKQILGESTDEHADPLASDKIEQTGAIEFTAPSPQDSPAFLQRSFGAKAQDTDRRPLDWLAGFFAAAATKAQSLAGLWRAHVVHDTSNPKAQRATGSVLGAMLAFLSLAAVFACAAAALALVQLKSLKTEIATLHRELGPLKERVAKLDQAEKAKLEADQKEGGQIKLGAEKNKTGAEPGTDQSALNLSREEIQLIRDFIKPAPAGGTPAPAINVGDPVGVATIPLPSPLMEKVPKLLGGRFTTRNGSIIILRRDSRQADAVLPPG